MWGVLVIEPYSFAVVCYEGDMIVFDSHAHGLQRALAATVPVVQAKSYFQHFFATYYQHLNFYAAGRTSIGHLTLLKLGLHD